MGYVTVAVAFVAAAAIIVAHPDDNGTDVEVDDDSASAHQQEAATYPLSRPVLAAHGDLAVAVRGAPESSLDLHSVDDGVLISQHPLPFADPVAYPDVVAIAEPEYLVAGTPCSSTR